MNPIVCQGDPRRLPQIQALRRQTGQGGASLVSIGIALIIGVIALAGILALAAGVFSSQKTSELVSQLNSIEQVTDGTFGSSPNGFANASAANVANLGQLPASQVVGTPPAAKGLQDAFHSNVYIDPGATAGSAVDNAYTVSFDGIPQSACVKAVTQDYGGEVQNIAVAAGGSDPGFVAPASPPVERLDVASAQGDCTNATNVISLTVVP